MTGYYPAAVKIFNQCYRAVCRDNLVIDLPNSNGIWYDVGNVDGVFVNNWIENVGSTGGSMRTDQVWPSQNGFFFEISKGAVCAGNVFVNCDHGLLVLNSSHVRIFQNTFFNSPACIARNARVAAGDHFGWHASTGPDVDKRDGHEFVNNLLTSGPGFDRPLLFVWQPAALCSAENRPMLEECDHDVGVRTAENPASPLVLWSPAPGEQCQAAFDSLEYIQKLAPGFFAHSRTFSGYGGPLFKSPDLLNFTLLPAFPGSDAGTPVPGEVGRLLGVKPAAGAYVGAYAPHP